MIATADLESAIRSAIPVSHLEIIDTSSGCGENYAIILVSEVRGSRALSWSSDTESNLLGPRHPRRRLKARRLWLGIDTVMTRVSNNSTQVLIDISVNDLNLRYLLFSTP